MFEHSSLAFLGCFKFRECFKKKKNLFMLSGECRLREISKVSDEINVRILRICNFYVTLMRLGFSHYIFFITGCCFFFLFIVFFCQ